MRRVHVARDDDTAIRRIEAVWWSRDGGVTFNGPIKRATSDPT